MRYICAVDTASTTIQALNLRPYQKKVVKDTYDCIRAGAKRILIYAPTGAGKTIIAVQIVKDAAARGKRILFVVHRETLLEQTWEKLYKLGFECGFIKAGWSENYEALIQIASVQTLAKREWWHHLAIDLVILDEAHIVAFARAIRAAIASHHPQAIYIGLSATPWRLKKEESLKDIFDHLVSAPSPRELIDAGFLVKPSYYSIDEIDLAKVGTAVDGDFDRRQLALACDRPELIAQVVQKWQELARDRRTIAFTVNVTHAQHLAAAFIEKGIPADWVSGATPAKKAKQLFEQLASGEIILCSCMKLTEGFDVPSISAVLLCRPTKSKALHYQMVGRALRLSPETNKTDALIIDLAGNILRNGFVEEIQQVSLEQRDADKKTECPKKTCPQEAGGCGAIIYAFQLKCPHCNFIFKRPEKVYLMPNLKTLISVGDEERYEFYRSQIRTAYTQKYSPGWAAFTFKERYGHWPPNIWARGAVFGDRAKAYTVFDQAQYYQYLSAIATDRGKEESWVQRYMLLEFASEYL